MEHNNYFNEQLFQLARLALTGRQQDILLFLQRLSRKMQAESPDMSSKLRILLKEMPTQNSPLRNNSMDSMPVDQDSRLKLMKFEHPIALDIEPIWDEAVEKGFQQILKEREHEEKLSNSGLSPTRSILFSGAPGVGKTLAARWLAKKLDLPLLTLDLSSVMSSFLGKTGNNIRNVFDYAKGTKCILFLDELDAIAKRRDDSTDVGELKRLVTVILQEIDDWTQSNILLAATNHPQLLDPAVWRRFDVITKFPMPKFPQVLQAVKTFLNHQSPKTEKWHKILSIILAGSSFSDIEKEILRTRKKAIIEDLPLEELFREMAKNRIKQLPAKERLNVAIEIMQAKFSQRQANEWTGVSRDTIRKKMNPDNHEGEIENGD